MAPPKKVYEKKRGKGASSQQTQQEKLTPTRKKARTRDTPTQPDTSISVPTQATETPPANVPSAETIPAIAADQPSHQPDLNPAPTPQSTPNLPTDPLQSQFTPTPEPASRTPLETQSEPNTETFSNLLEELNEEAGVRGEEDGDPYDDFRFSSVRAQKGFAKYWSKRPVIVERGMELSHFQGEEFKLKQNFEARKWEKWAQFRGTAVVPIVQEFYANILDIKKEEKDCIVTKVRGIHIEVSPKDVRKFFRLKEEKQPQFPLSIEEALDKDALAKVLTGNPKAEWGHKKKIAKNRLNSKFNSLHFLACSQLNPVMNTSELSYERGLLLYAIDKGMKVELGQLLWENMAEASKIKKGVSGLPFAGFITKFVCKKKVITELGEQVAKPLGHITASSRERSASHKKNKEGTTTAEFMEQMMDKWDEVRVKLGEIKNDQYFIKQELQSQGKRIAAIEAKLDSMAPSSVAGTSSLPSEDPPLNP